MRLGIASPPKPKNEIRLPARHLAAGRLTRELNAARLDAKLLERRLDGRVVAFRYPLASEVAD
jgi:hypothetical protein